MALSLMTFYESESESWEILFLQFDLSPLHNSSITSLSFTDFQDYLSQRSFFNSINQSINQSIEFALVAQLLQG